MKNNTAWIQGKGQELYRMPLYWRGEEGGGGGI